MADTQYGTNAPEVVKAWSRKLFREALKQTHAGQFMGQSSNSLIQVKDDLAKGPGDRIRCILRAQLTGDGIAGDNTLEGNEEALTTYTDDVLIDQLRHAVRSGGKMTEQRIPFSVREEARMGLQDWWADRIDTAFFNQIAGNTSESDTRKTGSNAAVAFDTDHVVYPDSDTSESDVNSSGASSVFSLTLIDTCIEKSQTLTTPIRPVVVGNQNYYVMFIHPYQAHDLRTSTDTGQWLDIQKAAMQGGKVSDNPIFTGALGMYNNTIIHVNSRVPSAPGFANVRRSVFCGAQAAGMALGQNNSSNKMSWFEEVFDFGNQLGVSAGMIWGLKKMRFNSADFATVTVPTYAVAH